MHFHSIDFKQESLDELKLVVGDSFENVASLQDCHFQQRDSVQTLGKVLSVEMSVKTLSAIGNVQSKGGRL